MSFEHCPLLVMPFSIDPDESLSVIEKISVHCILPICSLNRMECCAIQIEILFDVAFGTSKDHIRVKAEATFNSLIFECSFASSCAAKTMATYTQSVHINRNV
jgi:hypothetical protein